MKSPKDLSFEDLVEIAEYAQGGLYLDTDFHGRLTWDPDKEVSGADFVEHVIGVLAKHSLIPECVEPYESNDEEDGGAEAIVVVLE